MPDLDALQKQRSYTASQAADADASVAGLEEHVANLRAALADGEDALVAAKARAKDAHAAAAAAADELAAAEQVVAQSGDVLAPVGTATGRVVK